MSWNKLQERLNEMGMDDPMLFKVIKRSIHIVGHLAKRNPIEYTQQLLVASEDVEGTTLDGRKKGLSVLAGLWIVAAEKERKRKAKILRRKDPSKFIEDMKFKVDERKAKMVRQENE